MKFAQLKVQRALRTLEIANHKSFIPIPQEVNEVPNSNMEHVQLRPDLPRNSQPAAVSVRDGSIYVISRNVPSRNIRPGNVLLLNLRRAAAVLADDSYQIATDEEVAREMVRIQAYKKDMAEKDRQIRMQSQGIENNITLNQSPQPAINVTVSMPEGFKMVPITDEDREQAAGGEARAAKAPRKGRPKSAAAAVVPSAEDSKPIE